ncbi:isopentenyldiphosphate isomerase [Wenyingzhuangia heitensis]|uniref:Isopentenyldiphosphate isomerase n=1 Tax=Wenyingzhuangia heitensis TaxID=1487859 RepID=A0ABX0UCD4_9FLAO|nr:NUDIX domain-containing protein [Wenyingzhuangia heitensis]NIJ46499.1 isopentenyldiphosphate isomerase [Wenyingzhuangia heitensis]
MDELIDIVNLMGQPTGNACMKSFAHQNGILHASVHIWFYHQNGKILIQKRNKKKEIYPNLWDVSVAGHVASEENFLDGAIREIKEEVDLTVIKDQLIYKGIWEEKHAHSNGLIDHEIHHIYLTELKTNLTDLTPQPEEVSDLKLVTLDYLENNYKDTTYFVPHDVEYYKHIIDLLKEAI